MKTVVVTGAAQGVGLAVGHRCANNPSKHGLIGLTKTLAVEWGGRGCA